MTGGAERKVVKLCVSDPRGITFSQRGGWKFASFKIHAYVVCITLVSFYRVTCSTVSGNAASFHRDNFSSKMLGIRFTGVQSINGFLSPRLGASPQIRDRLAADI